MGIPLPAGQLYEGRSLYAPPGAEDRLIYLNTYGQYGILAGNRFVCGDRKADAGGSASSPRTAYVVSNQGSRTLFTEDHAAKVQPVFIQPFDEFQENLLRNYSLYCGAVHQAPQTASLRSGL